jgi:predicted DNA-binding antitoxin AbrB/MazE fold protein
MQTARLGGIIVAALPLTVEAVFEDGVFRPVTPVSLEPHQRVRITVSVVRQPRDWPADTAEIYRELADEDRRLAGAMFADVRATWPTAKENEP